MHDLPCTQNLCTVSDYSSELVRQANANKYLSHKTRLRATTRSRMKSGRTYSRAKCVSGIASLAATILQLVCSQNRNYYSLIPMLPNHHRLLHISDKKSEGSVSPINTNMFTLCQITSTCPSHDGIS
jgi:hypothetical protein